MEEKRKEKGEKKREEPSKEEENKKWGETRGKEIEVGNSVTRKGTREKKMSLSLLRWACNTLTPRLFPWLPTVISPASSGFYP